MARRQSEVQEWARRIEALPDAEKVKLMAQVMLAEGKKIGWSAIDRIQAKTRKLKLDPQEVDRVIDSAVREVRAERRRKARG